MHFSAREIGYSFVKNYVGVNSKVLEVGSYDVNGGIRSHVDFPVEWLGVDLTKGPGVDLVLEDPYALPFEENLFDVVVTSSTFEHNAFFWLTFQEMVRVCKKNGLIYVNAPSNGLVHQFPIDAYRFFPDAGVALQDWSERCGKKANLVESFVADRLPKAGTWNDFVAVFEIESRNQAPRLYKQFSYRNGRVYNLEKGKLEKINHRGITEDIDRMRALEK